MPPDKGPLTDADRARIRAEEIERAKVRAEIEAEAPSVQQVQVVQQSRGGLGCFGWGVLTVIGLVVFFACTSLNAGTGVKSSGSDSESLDVGSFGIKCQHAVSDQLKAPATAQFQNFFIDQTEGRLTGDSASGWHWTTYVDSQNSFGANIRTNFTCLTAPNGTEVRVSLESQ